MSRHLLFKSTHPSGIQAHQSRQAQHAPAHKKEVIPEKITTTLQISPLTKKLKGLNRNTTLTSSFYRLRFVLLFFFFSFPLLTLSSYSLSVFAFLLYLSPLPSASCSRSLHYAWLYILSPRHLLHLANLFFPSLSFLWPNIHRPFVCH